MFEIRFAEGVEEDLKKVRIYYRNQILDAIEEQLAHEPGTRTRNRKRLENNSALADGRADLGTACRRVPGLL